jgi:hypothetical protein
MSDRRLTELNALTTIDATDLLYVVDVSDTTESAEGTSKKITRANLVQGLITGVAWGDITGTLSGQTDLQAAFDDLEYDTAKGTVVALGALGSSETIDWSAGTHFTGTLDDDVTIGFSNDATGQKITLAFIYSGAQRTITWSDVDKWAGGSAPDAPSASGEELVVTLMKIGSTIYASGEVFS